MEPHSGTEDELAEVRKQLANRDGELAAEQRDRKYFEARVTAVRAEIDGGWPNALGRNRAILDGEYT